MLYLQLQTGSRSLEKLVNMILWSLTLVLRAKAECLDKAQNCEKTSLQQFEITIIKPKWVKINNTITLIKFFFQDLMIMENLEFLQEVSQAQIPLY